jgi:hypothetical protein
MRNLKQQAFWVKPRRLPRTDAATVNGESVTATDFRPRVIKEPAADGQPKLKPQAASVKPTAISGPSPEPVMGGWRESAVISVFCALR